MNKLLTHTLSVLRFPFVSVLLVVVFALSSIVSSPVGVSSAGVDYGAHSYTDRVVDRTYVTLFNRHVDTKARDYWYPRAMERADAKWFAEAVMNSDEYKRGLGRLSNTDFINTIYKRAAYRSATSNEQTLWQTSLKNGSQTRAGIVAWTTENLHTYKLTRPVAVSSCSQYNRGGGVTPLCDRGSAGHQKNVSIVRIPNTEIYVNRAWYYEVDTFVKLAKSKGYNLSVERDGGTPSWMLSPGSWRSWDEQKWLYDNGYPANPPGKSMHEWGLALDLDCNGKPIHEHRACWDWVRANGGKYNIRNFYTVSKPTQSEAWHFSSNGL